MSSVQNFPSLAHLSDLDCFVNPISFLFQWNTLFISSHYYAFPVIWWHIHCSKASCSERFPLFSTVLHRNLAFILSFRSLFGDISVAQSSSFWTIPFFSAVIPYKSSYILHIDSKMALSFSEALCILFSGEIHLQLACLVEYWFVLDVLIWFWRFGFLTNCCLNLPANSSDAGENFSP